MPRAAVYHAVAHNRTVLLIAASLADDMTADVWLAGEQNPGEGPFRAPVTVGNQSCHTPYFYWVVTLSRPASPPAVSPMAQ